MKILITTTVDPLHSAYSRLHAFAEILSRKHNITILSVRDKWKESQNISKSYENEAVRTLSNIEIIYLTDKKKSIIYQEIFSRLLARNSLEIQKDNDYDLILDYNTITLGSNASKIVQNAPRIYDLADDLVDMVRISPQIPTPINVLASTIARRMILKNIKESDAITGTNDYLLDKYGVSYGKRKIIPNAIPTRFLETVTAEKMINLKQNENEFIIGYVGVLREWVDFKPLFYAVRHILQRKPIRIIIIGEEGGQEKISRLASQYGIESAISMIGTKPHDEIRNYLAACDCGIIPFGISNTSEFSLPLKFFEYLSVQIPVISTPIRTLLDNFGEEAYFYRNSNELIAAISSIIENPEIALAKSVTGFKKISKEYTWENVVKKLEELIFELT